MKHGIDRNNVHLYLAYAGLVPFIACALALAADVSVIPVLGGVKHALAVYALVIASFMAGVHWGQHLGRTDAWAMYLAGASNLVAIAIWLLYLLLSLDQLLLMLGAAFIVLLWIDRRLFKLGCIAGRYFRTRCRVTLVVLLTLTTAVAFS